MNLHSGDADGQEGVQEGDACVGVGGGIEDDAVVDAPGGLDLVNQVSFVVGLVNRGLQAQGLGRALNEIQKVLVGGGAVNFRLPQAQQIEVGAVEDQKLHGAVTSRICRTVSSRDPAFETM